METGRGGRHGTLRFGIDSLIVLEVCLTPDRPLDIRLQRHLAVPVEILAQMIAGKSQRPFAFLRSFDHAGFEPFGENQVACARRPPHQSTPMNFSLTRASLTLSLKGQCTA